MERRNRNILVVLIGIVIAVAMLSSFGLGLFAPDTAQIQLPTPPASQSQVPVGEEAYVRVEITPHTVRQVVADTLTRPESYGRTVTVRDFWGDGDSGVTTATVWVDGGWTHTTAVLPGGAVRHTIVGEGRFWLWYDGNSRVLTGSAEADSADLEGQRIPTYEDVLELKESDIADAGYEDKEGVACIYVETAPDSSGYVDCYWISVDSGLLSYAETTYEGELIYQMAALSVDRPVPENASFTLPDGTVLHETAG